jgi:hypothetical protein
MRLAIGLSAWGNVDLQIYFAGDALWAFDESAGVLGTETIRHCLPLLTEGGRPLLVPSGGKPFVQRAAAPVFCRELDATAIATVAAQSRYVLRF